MGLPFEQIRSALFTAYESGRFADALVHAEAAHAAWPAHHADTFYWRACLLSLLDRPDEAVLALGEALEGGLWWSPAMLDEENDLAAVRYRPDFSAIRARCAGRWEEARAAARPHSIIIAPSSALWEPRSLLFLHWWGGSARESAARWQGLVDQGWTLVAAQSSQPCSPQRFCWDDREAALREVRGQLEHAYRERAVPADGMVLAGASQGAAIAIEAAAEAGLPWLAVIPTLPRDLDLSRLPGVPHRTRGAFLLGADDPATARAVSAAEMLKAGGGRVSVRIVPGVGHDQVPAMVPVAAELLRWLVDGTGGPD
jgi:predicted esterase